MTYFCRTKRTLCHSSLKKFWGNPLCKVTTWYSGLRRQFIWSQLRLSFLNHRAPSRCNPVACMMVLSKTKMEKSPIYTFFPLKSLAKRKAISSLYPVNFSKNGNHPFLRKSSLADWNSRVFSITCCDNGSCLSMAIATDFCRCYFGSMSLKFPQANTMLQPFKKYQDHSSQK